LLDQFFTIWRRDASTGVAPARPAGADRAARRSNLPPRCTALPMQLREGCPSTCSPRVMGSGQGQPTSSRAGLLGRTSLSSGAPTRAADPDGELDAGGTCIRLHQHPVPAFPWDSSLDQDSSPFLSCTDFGNWKPQAEFHSGWIAHEIFLVRKACRFDLGFADILRRGRNL